MTIFQTVEEQSNLPLIAVIDLGAGNLHSVLQALRAMAPKHRVLLTTNSEDILAAERVVLPGQGAMFTCMQSIYDRNLENAIRLAISQKPVFAICVGLQLFFQESEEGNVPCLGMIPGRVKHLSNLSSNVVPKIGHNSDINRSGNDQNFKIPHMGWSQVKINRLSKPHPIWAGFEGDPYFYFAHSFYVDSEDPKVVIGTTDYLASFVSVIAFNNVVATQFHPEKSGKNGLHLLKNFVEWDPK